MKKLISLFLGGMLLLAVANRVFATDVFGPVSGVWTAQGSPYYVIDSVYVPSDSTLIIEAGVQVNIWGHLKFGVHHDATLKVHGVEGDSVVFTTPWHENGWWGMHFISSSPACSLAYAVFEYGRATGSGEDTYGGAIYCRNASPTIVHSRFSKNYAASGGAIYCRDDADPLIMNNLFSADSAGSGGAIYAYHASPIIANNAISFNFAAGSGGGIYLNYANAAITDNVIQADTADYGGGVYCYYSYALIQNNSIEGNQANLSDAAGGGIYLDNAAPIFMDNDIVGNTSNGTSARGGGIYFYNSSPTLTGNFINANMAVYGAGVYTNSSSPIFEDNTITENTAIGYSASGGGVYCQGQTPRFDGNVISHNLASGGAAKGGGFYLESSNATIQDNDITENEAHWGGAVACYSSHPTVRLNRIRENSAVFGGAFYTYSSSHPDLDFNEIALNHAADSLGKGGAMYCDGFSTTNLLNRNTFYGNTAGVQGGAFYLVNSTMYLKNGILWANSSGAGSQIYLAYNALAVVTYSDVQGGWPGNGNFSLYPIFVDTAAGNYHLQPDSPCIDAGDPHPGFNDPDFSPADMGCYYFDQGLPNPITVEMTPISPPIQIPFFGGTFDFEVQLQNSGPISQMLAILFTVTLPSGGTYGPLAEAVSIPLAGGMTLTKQRSQVVPPTAPAGAYAYNIWVYVGADSITDSFPFEKTVPSGSGDMAGWDTYGEPWEIPAQAIAQLPQAYAMSQNYPNPFNATTSLSFDLPGSGWIGLAVYDLSGRKVADLVNGWRDAGSHRVTFDASNFASGIYICRLEAGHWQVANKMVLLK